LPQFVRHRRSAKRFMKDKVYSEKLEGSAVACRLPASPQCINICAVASAFGRNSPRRRNDVRNENGKKSDLLVVGEVRCIMDRDVLAGNKSNLLNEAGGEAVTPVCSPLQKKTVKHLSPDRIRTYKHQIDMSCFC
jgi:hypothetical protein